ncbi:MAG: NgoBV family restriction endonuclease [Prevotellamassilia sp.]
MTIEQNYVVGNILEEWLAKWLANQGIENVHNKKQSSPDFWLDKEQTNDGWLEVKSFIGSPNFDIGSFRSYINEIIHCPWKLHTKYLLIKYYCCPVNMFNWLF